MNPSKSDKTTLFWAALGALLLLFLIFISGKFNGSENRVKLVIDYGDGRLRSFMTYPKPGTTAWDFLQQASAQYEISLEAAAGFNPAAIGGLNNGEGGKKWVWYKNGKRQKESPLSEYITAGEEILYRFE